MIKRKRRHSNLPADSGQGDIFGGLNETGADLSGNNDSGGMSNGFSGYHPNSFKANDSRLDFGNGGAKDNPVTTGIVKSYLKSKGIEPTDDKVDFYVHMITYEAQRGDCSEYGGGEFNMQNYENMAQDVMQSHLDLDEAFEQSEPELNDWDYATSAVVWEANANESGQEDDGSNNGAAQQGNKPTDYTPNQPEINDPTYETPWDVSVEPYNSAQSAINDIDNLTDLDYDKYRLEIEVATQNATNTNERETKRDFVAVTETLKDLYERCSNLSPNERNRVRSAIARKVIQMMRGRVGYNLNSDSGAALFDSEYFTGRTSMVCAQFVALIGYITGNTSSLRNNQGHNSWWFNYGYEYANGFTHTTSAQLNSGSTNLAYNRTMMRPATVNGQQIGRQQLINMLQNNNVEALRNLEGKALMWKSGTPNTRNFKFYSHSVIIGPYNPETGTITIYESNEAGNSDPRDGLRYREIDINTIRSLGNADIYEFRN